MEVSGDSALGRVFREGVMEERPKGEEGSECMGAGAFQAEGIVRAQVPV